LLKQQVVLSIASSEAGYLQGQARIELSAPAGLPDLEAGPALADLVGSITPEGHLDLALTTATGTVVRATGSLLNDSGEWHLELQSAAGESPRLIQQAGFRLLAENAEPAPLDSPKPARGQDRWSWLPGTSWYVPVEGLLAYILGPAGTAPIPIGDQTVYDVAGYDRGYFWGPTTVTFSGPTGVGGYGSEPLQQTMLGCVSPEGSILLSFGPLDGSTPPITGYGAMRLIDGEWSMENQMASPGTPTVMHWAPMKQLRPGQTPPEPALGLPPTTSPSDPWGFLERTSWYVPDENLPALKSSPGQAASLISDQTVYTIDRYAGGYVFGEGTVELQGGEPFTVSLAGSVTPPGALYLLFRDEQGTATIGLGRMTTYQGQASMENQMTNGHSQLITHWAYMLEQ
jgi:hypothetical protein